MLLLCLQMSNKLQELHKALIGNISPRVSPLLNSTKTTDKKYNQSKGGLKVFQKLIRLRYGLDGLISKDKMLNFSKTKETGGKKKSFHLCKRNAQNIHD